MASDGLTTRGDLRYSFRFCHFSDQAIWLTLALEAHALSQS